MTGSAAEIISFLKDKKKLLITSHEKPDGDALGSSLALARTLKAHGSEVGLVDFTPLAPRYNFMLEQDEIGACPDYLALGAEALVVMDCGDITRIGDCATKLIDKMPVVNIDHHSSNTCFGSVNWVEPEASSAGEMVYRLCREWGLTLPVSAAEPLWVAISTDTGDFTFSNTTSRVMRIAADLLDLGANPSHVRRNLQENMRLEELKLLDLCLQKLEVCPGGKVSYISLTRNDFQKFDCGPQDLHEPIDLARSIKGVCIALLLYEVPDEKRVKLSVRTYPPYDAAALCANFGGGGHPRAAGCSFRAQNIDDVLPDILAKIDEIL